jgi:methylated-DNA-[protein]-cysteine S-methyltransferase
MCSVETKLRPSSHPVQSPIYTGLLASSPIGSLWVVVSSNGLLMVEWGMPPAEINKRVERRFHQPATYDQRRIAEPIRQLAAYLDGKLRQFSLPLDLSGMTPFQVQVLSLTSQIPYGQTSTYKEIAVLSGKPNASRAIGRVEANNPLPLVIPCHRVVGSDGSLHGYGGPGGIKLKAWLLHLEQSTH